MGTSAQGKDFARRIGLCIVACLLAWPAAFAVSQPYLTHNYAIEEGLIQSQAAAIHQDQAGYLWIGTIGGLSRFDGLEFRNFTIAEGLINNRISALAEDSRGALWIGTLNGITVMEKGNFTHMTTEEGLLDNTINALHYARDGTMWIATQSGLSQYDGAKFKHFTQAEGLSADNVIDIEEDQDGNLWLATVNGICHKKASKFTCYGIENGIPSPFVADILVDSRQRIWVATSGGVALLSTDGLNQFVRRNDLPFQQADVLLEDQQGFIWIGARAGVLRLDNNGMLTHKWDQGDWITISLFEDSEHNVWAGTSGRGIVKFQQTAFSHMNPAWHLPNDVYLAAYQDDALAYWFGGMVSGLYKVDSTGVEHFDPTTYPALQHVRTIAQDSAGNIWAGGAGGASVYDGKSVKTYSTNNGLINPYVYSIRPDNAGRVWIGTGNGLHVFERDSIRVIDLEVGRNRRTVYTLQAGNDNKMWIGTTEGLMYHDTEGLHKIASTSKRPITTILPDNSGDLWLGTLGYGVLRYRPSTGALVDSLSVSDGLNGSTVYFTEFDGAGDLWVGTSRGVNHVNMDDYWMSDIKTTRSFGKNEGIVGVETNMNAATMDNEGRLWFGTIDAIMQYDATARPINETPPKVHLTDVRLYLEEIDLHDFITDSPQHEADFAFAHDENHLTFDFQGLSFTAPELVRYQYRMSGFDKDWQPLTAGRVATYANLPAGNYMFEVSAVNGDGTMSATPASLQFAVTPPFWKTAWFLTLAVFGAILGVVGVVQLRTRNLNRRRLALEETVATRTVDLKATHAKLVEAQEEALQAAKSRSAFMSTLTHELRTPMNGILGMTQVLQVTSLDEEQKDCADTIMNCSTMMMDLVENLLTFADLAAGKRTVAHAPFDVRHLLNEVVAAYAPQANKKGMEIRCYAPPVLPRQIESDREHIRQVLQHLLSNAVKFTQSGVIYVEAKLEKQDAAAPNMILSVHDTGIGMEKHQLKGVFDAFSQVDSSATRQFQGTGIGLSLAQQLTSLMRGKLTARAWPGIGASFYITLPVGVPDDAAEKNGTQNASVKKPRLYQQNIYIATADAHEKRRLMLLCQSFGMQLLKENQIAKADVAIADPDLATKLVFPAGIPLILLHKSTATRTSDTVLQPGAPGKVVLRILTSSLMAKVNEK
ncbi:MAG: two-component regulator propeller domain-containing protein [Bacteroidota bacterium]